MEGVKLQSNTPSITTTGATSAIFCGAPRTLSMRRNRASLPGEHQQHDLQPPQVHSTGADEHQGTRVQQSLRLMLAHAPARPPRPGPVPSGDPEPDHHPHQARSQRDGECVCDCATVRSSPGNRPDPWINHRVTSQGSSCACGRQRFRTRENPPSWWLLAGNQVRADVLYSSAVQMPPAALNDW